MAQIQPTGCFQQYASSHDVVVYHYNKQPAVELSVFNHALKLSSWRAHLKPFSCAVVHLHSQEIILARDHLGLEPLFYCHHSTIA